MNACLVPILRITMGNENGWFSPCWRRAKDPGCMPPSSLLGVSLSFPHATLPALTQCDGEYTFICRIAVFPPSIKHHLDLLNVLFCVVCVYGSENVQSTIKLYRANTKERNHIRDLRGSVVCLRETSSLLFTQLQRVARIIAKESLCFHSYKGERSVRPPRK